MKASVADSVAGPPQPLAPPYRQYAIIILQITQVLSLLDRQVLNILAEPIKKDLHIGDWQIGALSGLTFALFYTVFGIPIGRLAERGHRPRIIAVAMTIWSGFTVLSGFATSFLMLIPARVGVGIGEAGCSPPAQSLIADYTPRETRASALALYHMGAPIGTLAGLVVGGLAAEALGWRGAFICVGAPGLLFALVVWLTLPEPRTRAARALAPPAPKGEAIAAIRTLLAKPTFWFLSLGTGASLIFTLGRAPFLASFFLRVHTTEIHSLAVGYGMKSIGFLGLALGLTSGVVGVFGTWLGGRLADRFGRADARAYVAIPALAAIVGLPFYLWALSSHSFGISLAALTVSSLLSTIWYGPTYAALIGIVPPHMRATAAATFLFVINLLGLGLGPLAIGALSDLLSGPFGLGSGQGVRWALILSSLVSVITFALLWMARRRIRSDTVS